MENNIPAKSSEREERLERLSQLRANGIDPYPSKTSRTHVVSLVLDEFDTLLSSATPLTLAGRLRSKREHGNLSFSHLEDESASMQLAFSKKELGPDAYKLFIKSVDLGDIIEVSGTCFLTHKGEKSLMISSWRFLAKAVRPLPEKWHGLQNEDKRQRFRELEMISDRDSLARFQRRSDCLRELRSFMWENGFREIETPVLQTVYGGTYAKPFSTHYNALDFDLFLRIAPEIFLKRSIVGGFEKIFEIGKCFRNEGMGPAHLQEFTMFEFYWPYSDYEQLMDFTELMFSRIIEKVYSSNYEIKIGNSIINMRPPYPRITFSDLFVEYLGVRPEELKADGKIEALVKERGMENEVRLADKISWSAKMDELYKKAIRKKIVDPVFITDYPKEFMALAKSKAEDPEKVATFQLVVNGWELNKAYNELNDPIDQRERFEGQERLIADGDDEAMPYDHDFVESMEYGMPPMAGWGMGLDRFIALLEGQDNLRDMVIFPTMRPKNIQDN